MKSPLASLETAVHHLLLGITIAFWFSLPAASQDFEWVSMPGGPGSDLSVEIASDGSNFFYDAGNFSGQARFGPSSISSSGDSDVFLAKYRTDGQLQWVRSLGGPLGDNVGGIDVDPHGQVYVTGSFQGTADFGGISLTSRGGRDIYLACFSTRGDLKWVRQAGGSTAPNLEVYADDWANDIAISHDGSVYLAGEFFGTGNFDGHYVTARGPSDGFLARYTGDGSIVWVKRLGGRGTDDGNAVAVNEDGDVVLAGYFGGTADIGTEVLHSAGYVNTYTEIIVDWDAYVSKWSPSGSVIWATRAGGPFNDRAAGGIAFGPDKSIYVTGYFKQTAGFGGTSLTSTGERNGFVWKMRSDGSSEWAVAVQSTVSSQVYDVAYADHDRIYVTGWYGGNASFGIIGAYSAGDQEAYLAQVDTSGDFMWMKSVGGPSKDVGYSVMVNGPRVLMAGEVGPDAVFDSFAPASHGQQDAFVASIDLRPDPPTLISPAMDATSVPTSTMLTWSSVNLATRYDVQVAADAAFSNIVYTENSPETHVSFVAPVAEHEYYWRVSGVGLAGPGEWSDVGHFTVGNSGPLAAHLTAPANNATGVSPSPTFVWTAAPGASLHRIQAATSEAFLSPEIDTDVLTGTSFQAADLAFDTRYYWRVAGVDGAGKRTYSAPWSFVTMPATVAAPSLIAPSHDASGLSTSPELVWSPVQFADRYNVQVASDGAFQNLVYNHNTPGTKTVFTAPVAEHEYYWRAQAVGPVGGGPWSEIRRFVVGNTGPLAAQLTAPANNATGVSPSPTFVWTAAPGASLHRIQAATSEAFLSPEIDTDVLTGMSFQAADLAFDTRYYWRVAGVDGAGKRTYSAPWSFVTMPATVAAPSLIAPSHDASGLSTSPELVWSPVQFADRYNVQVASDGAFQSLVYSHNTPGTKTVFTAPVAEHEYSWRAQAVGPVGGGPWSEIRRFVVGNTGPLAAQLTAPANNATGVSPSPTFVWVAAPEAATYRIQVASSEGFVSPVVDVGGLSATSYQAPALDHETTYYWRVAGVSESGTSTYSAPRSFVTMIAPPGEVAVLSPQSGSEGVAPFATFVWQEIAGVDRYHVQVARDTEFSSSFIVVDDSMLTTNQYEMSVSLEYAATYFWRIRAHNLSGFGPWCPPSAFVVAVGTPTEAVDDLPADYYLSGAYPNPFNPSTQIEYGLPEASDVTLTIFDASGRLAAVLASGYTAAGRHTVTWQAEGFGSGVYFVRLQTPGRMMTQTVVIMK